MKMKMNMNERTYYSRLLHMADVERSDAIIENDSTLDSADVYERLFLGCSEEVFILARGIKKSIFKHSKVKSAAINFLSKNNAKLNMVLRLKTKEDYDLAIDSSFIQEVTDELSSSVSDKINIKFYEGGDNWLKKIGSVAIGDNRAYRYRYFQEDPSAYKQTANAHVCFNAPEKCKEYRELISKALENKTPKKEFNF